MMSIKNTAALFITFCLVFPINCAAKVTPTNVDICIYGATSGGVMAAYTAAKEGKKVLLIEPSDRIGGMTTGGLGQTDIGKIDIIRGYALDFYKRVGRQYGRNEPVFYFEPKVAQAVFNQYVSEAKIPILYCYRIVGARKKNAIVTSITLENALNPTPKTRKTIRAKIFVDCTYEGDLMARAGITYTVGRESAQQYGESWNGVQMLDGHQFPDGVDPYRIKGKPESGLLWGILPQQIGNKGQADKHLQAYNFRITLTDDPDNRIPIEKPANYDPQKYELLIRWKEVQPWRKLDDCFIWSEMPNRKTDINNRNGFSTDMIGANWNWPEASYDQRRQIFEQHLDYTKGLLYFIGHDERIPPFIREEMCRWGYPKDEYTRYGHFTPQLYIREGRRMIGRMVMTQHHCQQNETADDPIGWAAYTMDSHNCGRYVVDGMVKNEGNVEIPIPGPYNISYRAITPKANQAANVLVPVCLSASHIAYGSIRMEPVFMVLGETAALAACRAINLHGNRVQDVDAAQIMKRFEQIHTHFLEKCDPKSGKRKTTRKNAIPNRENVKPLGKMRSQIGKA